MVTTTTLRERLREEAGTTLIELMVSLAVLGIVMAIFLGVLAWVQTAFVRETVRSTTQDQARLAMEAIDRDVRTAAVLYDPSVETPTGYFGLRVAHLSTTGGATTCIQYRVQSQTLLRRSWTAGSSSATAWRTMAENVVNSTSASADRPFQLDTSAASGYGSALGSRVVNVTFVINAKPGSASSKDVRLASSMSIRNQTSGDPCSPVPSG